jgi:N-acetyl-anhydromuramyl-L-alanine amidase AmpD
MHIIEKKLIPVNFWSGRNGVKPVAIVNHIMEGTMNSTFHWFSNPASGASSHFGVSKKGEIWQFVEIRNTAWTNAPAKRPAGKLYWLDDNINPNRQTITIEHEGFNHEGLTEQQYQATLFLHRQLVKDYDIAINRRHIIGHYEINSIDRPNCPGNKFPFSRLLTDLNNVVVGEGIKQKLLEQDLYAVTNEQYQTDMSTGLKSSRTWCRDEQDVTFRLEVFQEPDNSWQKFELWKYITRV